MNREEKKEFICEHIGADELCAYLLGDFGWNFCLYADGTTGMEQRSWTAIDPRDRPIASLDCPGLGNIDSDYWVREWTIWDAETRDWVVSETGEHINLKEVIHRCCEDGNVEDGNVEDCLEELRQDLLESWEQHEENHYGYFAVRND